MNSRFIALALALTLIAGKSHAANLAVITTAPNLLNLAILVIALVCIFGSIKIFSLVRGGEFGKSWQLFTGGFVFLVLAQLAYLVGQIEVLVTPAFIVPGLAAAGTGLLLWGVLEAKRVLS